MKYLQWALWIVGLSLQYLVLGALMAGAYRQYIAVFLYVLFLIISTVADIALSFDAGNFKRVWYYYYWTAELVRQSLLYAAVVSLVVHAVPEHRRRHAWIRLLILFAIVFWLGSLAIHRQPRLSFWMTNVVRNLSFCAAILNLALWLRLISMRARDTRLLMVTGGLGLQMTGDAIGQSLRNISPATTLAGSLVIVLSHFICLYVWWQAFQPQTPARDRVSPEEGVRVH